MEPKRMDFHLASNSESLMERALNGTSIDTQDPLTISAIVGIAMAIVSIASTMWDLWEKWNAIIMLKYALSEMKNSDWSRLQKYNKYSEISFCMRDRIDEAVDTMNVVATYFKLLHYAATQCSRPDVHLDWLSTSKRCTRDFAAERVEEMQTEICSAQYAEGLFSTVDMLQDDSMVRPFIGGCACLEGYLCGGDTWCWVAADSSCPDKAKGLRGWYSSIPCEFKGMEDMDKARMLLKTTCTVCNHGFFRNAGLIQSDVYAGLVDPILKGKDIKEDRIREAFKERYRNFTVASGKKVPDLNVIDDDAEVAMEGKAYLAILKWERLMQFDQRCILFKNSLSVSERTQMTGEDLINEKIARFTVDGRLGKLGTDMEWKAETVRNVFARKGAKAFEDVAHTHPDSILELAELHEVRGSVERLQARTTASQTLGPNLKLCSDYKLLNRDVDDLKEMATAAADVIVSAECASVEGAISRSSAWNIFGVSCKCEAYSTQVYCGQERIAGRKWKFVEIATKGCASRMYCSRFPKTPKQVNFLVRARLGCSVVPGAKDKAMNSASECSCINRNHILFCADANYGRGTDFHLYDDVLNNRLCVENARCAKPLPLASLAVLNLANKKRAACRETIGAAPTSYYLTGLLGRADCTCREGESLFCGTEKIAEQEFNKLNVLQNGCSDFLYCSEKSKTEAEVLIMLRTAAKPERLGNSVTHGKVVENASLVQLRSSTEGAADVLLWVPLQLARVLRVSTQGVIDWGMAIWWFAFNNIYGAYATIEAFSLLSRATALWDKWVNWVGIITFFIWLINDAIFVGLNTAMCPRIADWIEIMDGVRAESGAKGNKGKESSLARDWEVYGTNGIRVNTSMIDARRWCDTQLEDVNDRVQKELVERTIILRKIVEFQQDLSMPVNLSDPSEVLGFLETDLEELETQVESLSWSGGNQSVGMELSKTHEKVTQLLKERLAPDALCQVAERVLQFPWEDIAQLNTLPRMKLQDIACRCDPRPQECGADA